MGKWERALVHCSSSAPRMRWSTLHSEVQGTGSQLHAAYFVARTTRRPLVHMKPIGTTTYRPVVLGFAQHAPPLLLARATFATLSPPPATPPPRSPQLTWPARRGPSAQALAAAQPGLAQWAKPSERRRRPAGGHAPARTSSRPSARRAQLGSPPRRLGLRSHHSLHGGQPQPTVSHRLRAALRAALRVERDGDTNSSAVPHSAAAGRGAAHGGGQGF